MTTAAFDDTESGSGTRPPVTVPAVTVPLHLVPADDVREVVTGHRTPAGALRVKAALDVVAALVLVLLLLPLLLVVAGLVALDGGPVFFRQTRVGRDGREFRMIKFRSMVVDAEARLAALASDGSGPLFKMRRDPRITRVGAVLRRYSLDELPQLFNVVAGTMSLVGPRPALPREVATYNAIARRRLAVKPGLTGLWQVSGRSDLSWDASIALDLRYVGQWTPGLDLKILARTAQAVVGGRGAY